jgi:transcriptional regulator with XRE-family HTH domain
VLTVNTEAFREMFREFLAELSGSREANGQLEKLSSELSKDRRRRWPRALSGRKLCQFRVTFPLAFLQPNRLRESGGPRYCNPRDRLLAVQSLPEIARVRGSQMVAGDRLQDIRFRLGLTVRDVAERSERIAQDEANEEFQISSAWLVEVENSSGIPSVYKLYSLSVIYHIKFSDLLLLYGVDVERITRHRMLMPPKQTYPTPVEVFDRDRTAIFPVRFDQGFNVEKTNLISRIVEIWGEVPMGLIQHLDFRNSLYGFIGLEDFTLYPLLRPGSFVQIDQRVKKVRPTISSTEYDRPIYFVELRDGYVCSWCELQGTQLILTPHPLSPCATRLCEFPREASIVGQVTGVAMRIADDSHARASDEILRLPKRP